MTRDAAIDWAAAARATRHEVRESLSTGRTTLADVLARASQDDLVGQVKLLWTLESLPGARKVDTRRQLAAMGLAESTRLSTLDPGTVARLLGAFGPQGASR